ncbi:hypothetical protein C7271_08495 [filamentous cyanobacterium CCP5]|nr:hypothetical protein C7271_08495 [filamentous cyanobacterium CCP5]
MGEPGIGKTLLRQKLSRDLQTTGGHIIWGKGYEAEMLCPLGFWLDAFEAIGAHPLLADLKLIMLDVGTITTLNMLVPHSISGWISVDNPKSASLQLFKPTLQGPINGCTPINGSNISSAVPP